MPVGPGSVRVLDEHVIGTALPPLEGQSPLHGDRRHIRGQIRTSRPFLSRMLKSFSDGPLGRLSPISH